MKYLFNPATNEFESLTPTLRDRFALGGGVATPKRGLVDGPGSYSQEKVPSPYLNDKNFLKFLNENYPNQPRDKLNTAYEAYERMLLKKNKTIGTRGLIEALGEDNPYSKDAFDRAFGNVGDRTIKKNMSPSEKSKINFAKKLRKIIVDIIGEPKSYADELKKYRYLKREFERYDLKPVEGSGFKKYFELDNKKIKALNKALNENYRKVGLRANTIDNIYNLFDDKEFMKSLKSYKGGEVDLDSALFKKVFKPGLAGERSYAYMMLGRALRGEIELEGIKKNKALGNKIIKSIASDKNLTRYGQMDKAALRWAKFQMAKHFDDPKANYDTITRTISKAFRDAGINKKLGYTLVTDEIFPARTGQLTIKGSGAYNQFVQFIDKSINENAKRSFDGRASTRYQEIIKEMKRKNPDFTRVEDLVNDHNKDIKNTYKKNPEMKGKVKLTQLNYDPKTKKFASPTQIYGTKIPPKILSDMEKFYRKTKLSLDVGTTMTLEKAAAEMKKNPTKFLKDLGMNSKDITKFNKIYGGIPFLDPELLKGVLSEFFKGDFTIDPSTTQLGKGALGKSASVLKNFAKVLGKVLGVAALPLEAVYIKGLYDKGKTTAEMVGSPFLLKGRIAEAQDLMKMSPVERQAVSEQQIAGDESMLDTDFYTPMLEGRDKVDVEAVRERVAKERKAEEALRILERGKLEDEDSDLLAGLLEESGSPYMQFIQGGGQLTPEQFYQLQSIPQSERPLTGELDLPEMDKTMMAAQGGRVGFQDGTPNPIFDQIVAALNNTDLIENLEQENKRTLEEQVLGEEGDRTLMQTLNTMIDPRAYPYYAQEIASGAANIPELAFRFPFAVTGLVSDLATGRGDKLKRAMETLDPKVTKAIKEKIGFTDMLEESREKATGPQRTTGGILELGAEIPGPATPYFLLKAFPKIGKEIRNLVGTAAASDKVNKEIERRLAVENVDQTRRDILLAAGSGGAIAVLKFLGLDKLIPATKIAKATPEIITKGGTPKYFFDFVNLIKTKGDDVTDKAATIERQKVYDYEGYRLEEDMTTGGVRISKDTEGGATYSIGDDEYETIEGIIRKEEIGYSPSETIIGKDGKPVKVPDNYEEYTMKPDYDGGEGDVDSGLESIDEILELLKKEGKTYSDEELLKMGIDPDLTNVATGAGTIPRDMVGQPNPFKPRPKKAEGGIIAGASSGPPPKSGPTPHGLPYVAKNVRPIKERR